MIMSSLSQKLWIWKLNDDNIIEILGEHHHYEIILHSPFPDDDDRHFT
jgi:hypothetical protein